MSLTIDRTTKQEQKLQIFTVTDHFVSLTVGTVQSSFFFAFMSVIFLVLYVQYAVNSSSKNVKKVMAKSLPRTFRIQEYEHFQQQLSEHNILGQTVLYDIQHHTNTGRSSEMKQYDDHDYDHHQHGIENKVSNDKSVSFDVDSNQWYLVINKSNNLNEVMLDDKNNNSKVNVDNTTSNNEINSDSNDDRNFNNSYLSPGNDNFKNISKISEDRIIYISNNSTPSTPKLNSNTPISSSSTRLQQSPTHGSNYTSKQRGILVSSSPSLNAITTGMSKHHESVTSHPFVLESKLRNDLTTSILDREEESRARYDLEQSKQLMIDIYQVNEVKLRDEIMNLKRYYSDQLNEKGLLYSSHLDSKQLEISKLEGRIHELINSHKKAIHEQEEYYLQQINQQEIVWKNRVAEMDEKHQEITQAMSSKHFIERSGREISEKAKMDVREEHWKQVCEKKLKKYEAQVMMMTIAS